LQPLLRKEEVEEEEEEEEEEMLEAGQMSPVVWQILNVE
jgi:hypothetical protein